MKERGLQEEDWNSRQLWNQTYNGEVSKRRSDFYKQGSASGDEAEVLKSSSGRCTALWTS